VVVEGTAEVWWDVGEERKGACSVLGYTKKRSCERVKEGEVDGGDGGGDDGGR
jgi:hypothetical protein